mmetsp:Transcript_118016/g.214617  ORF Transcript_118016/g.214617 Transcript_118016/m.214617 type:complete len:633 (-) Transcript_118016:5-1903(-)
MLLVALCLTVCLLLPLPAHLQKDTDILGPAQVIAWQGEELRQLEAPAGWAQLDGPVGTACITGDDRVGKSTLLTLWGRTAARTRSFAFTAGHNRSSHTQGLWSAILPKEATGLDYHLSLCDSQGLKQVGELQQWRLFSANVLVPSVLIYMVINVVQNDQLRDLASMAHQFQKLSSEEFDRFQGSLSPHLIVVVRDESDLDGEDAHDLSAHLEDALSGKAYAKDKELIKQVFKTREAWSLHELPRSARRKLRDAGDVQPLNLGKEAEPWRLSALAILQRVQQSLQRRIHAVPQSGPDLIEWYSNVVETVNSKEDGSMGTLIGHAERLGKSRLRRHLLEEWWSPLYAIFVGTALFGLSGFIGVWMDRIACLAWVALCAFYVGASPLLITPLHGVIPRLCEEFVGASGGFFARAACQEASAQSVAILLAAALGLLTYPMLTSRVRWLLGMLPLPGRWQRVGTALALAAFMQIAWALHSFDLNATIEAGGLWSLAARIFLVVTIIISAVQSVLVVQHNRAQMQRSCKSRELHFYVTSRLSEVAQLEASSAWRAHFRHYGERNSLWRYRLRPFWPPLVLFLQASGFLAWAQLLYPRCDLVLTAGTATSSLQLLWRCVSAVKLFFLRFDGSDPWGSWL